MLVSQQQVESSAEFYGGKVRIKEEIGREGGREGERENESWDGERERKIEKGNDRVGGDTNTVLGECEQ
jgi:hypothetical protein